MRDLDDRLDAAAAELHRAVAQVGRPPSVPLSSDEERGSSPFAPPLHDGRRRLVVVALLATAVALAGGLAIARQSSTSRTEATDGPTSTVASPALFDLADPPLELRDTPPGYARAGQLVRPAGGDGVRSAVFIRRDGQGLPSSKVIVRVGQVGIAGAPGGSANPGFIHQAAAPPANLTTATSGSLLIDQIQRLITLGYDLGALGHLVLESHHPDVATDLATARDMEQIAASLNIVADQPLQVTAPLPTGWELAASGNEPELVTSNFYQAFEVDTPDGGAKILISNLYTNDPAVPFWEMSDTLVPLVIRGHSGYATDLQNTTAVTTLIWPETPNHWVTVRADNMTTTALLALAAKLTPAPNGGWGQPTPGATTTTSGPGAPTT